MVDESRHRGRLQQLFEDLKSAFYEAEEILDDVEYHRLKKQIKDNKMKPDSDVSLRKRDWVKKKLQSAVPSFPLKDQKSGMAKTKLKQSLDKIEKVINDTCGILEKMNLPSIINANRSHAVAASSRGAVTTATPPLVVIGRGEDCDKIAAMLHETEQDGLPGTNSTLRYSVIGIHGIGGSGKSTLAQLVCDREKKDKQEKKDGHFDLVMWVHVTQSFSVDTIFKMMFNAATGTPCPHFDNPDILEVNLKNELQGKRFLLVLDDVWYSNGDDVQYEKLQKILTPLNAGEAGSKILLTSRTEDALIALGAEEQRRILIPALDEDVFLKLFMHYALPSVPIDDGVRRTLEDIGKEIAKKLKGSPLAARTVGGQLRTRTNVDFWLGVRDGDILNETMGALWWSYRHLDEQVRRCFVYCSIFPRSRCLKRDELVKLWAAAGFARSANQGEDTENICQEYFDQLVSASFLQIGVRDQNDYYIVHDLLRDLAEKVAGRDHLRIENHAKLIKHDFCYKKLEWIIEGSAVDVDVQHVFVQTYDAALITEKICKLKSLRTLIIDSVWAAPVEKKVLEHMFVRLKKLRVLSIAISADYGQKMLSVPASVGQLRHLRYLAFRTKESQLLSMRLVLPGTLSKLYHMQVLHFGGNLLLTSSEDWCDLINLRHVIYSKDLKIGSIDRLTSLQTLGRFMVRKEQGYQLKQLGNLNKLGGELCICGIENIESKAEALEANLADKGGLRKLVLQWDGVASAEVETEVLEGLCPPKYLDELTIEGYIGLRYPSWMDGEDNGGPKYLKNLKFSGCSQELGPELRGFVSHLRVLSIQFCSWVSLPDCMEHLRSLHELSIRCCSNIRSLPTMPQSLQDFRVHACNDVLMGSCKIIGDPNWEKVQHIPRARIGGKSSRSHNYIVLFAKHRYVLLICLLNSQTPGYVLTMGVVREPEEAQAEVVSD
ncbi:Putative disease resistance RPP13-like protein 1 [Triticum urartu]|uniref:Putative disease resistance RPP13-like protein 1 n=1 Tax=Triticum urartu TaxID=4572 RepID=M7ZHK0_TRIUA|nr:Putative disease resistance RPP13-like protein 1 [Triticum urartu]